MFQSNIPEKLLSHLHEEDKPTVIERYERMKIIANEQKQGLVVSWSYQDIALPKKMQSNKKATFIWACLYNITFHPMLTIFGTLILPIAVGIQCVAMVRWLVINFIG